VTDPVREKVLAVYETADAAVRDAGPKCEASGKCCRFTEYGHTLFISHFEADILLESAPAYTQPVTRDGCPFQVGGLCTARDARPLGCRIYFCDPAYTDRMVEITETAIAKLKAIADEHDAGWNYAPLHHFLNAAVREGPRVSAPDSMTPPDSRLSLPVVSIPDEAGA
jgi:Fe-S-cluster containining protein